MSPWQRKKRALKNHLKRVKQKRKQNLKRKSGGKDKMIEDLTLKTVSWDDDDDDYSDDDYSDEEDSDDEDKYEDDDDDE